MAARNDGRADIAAQHARYCAHTKVKSVEETYGIHNLHLTVARGYIAKLLANTRVARWLTTQQ